MNSSAPKITFASSGSRFGGTPFYCSLEVSLMDLTRIDRTYWLFVRFHSWRGVMYCCEIRHSEIRKRDISC